MLDTKTPYSDGWWIKRLLAKRNTRPVRPPRRLGDARRYSFTCEEWDDLLWNTYTAEPPLSAAQLKYTDASQDFLRMANTNYAALVVEAPLDRVQFQGVRSSQGDADGDDYVRQFLQANGAFIQDAEEFAFVLGRGYVLVGGGDDDTALATAEDPRQWSIETDPFDPRKIRAALKRYQLDDAHYAALYLSRDDAGPERCVTYMRAGAWSGRVLTGPWERDESHCFNLMPGHGVPLVPLVNRGSRGEFENHLELLDRIRNGISDRMWAAKYQIFIQRAISGDLPEKNPDTGEIINYDELFESDPGAMWRLPPDAKIWESRQLDLNTLLAPVREDVKELAATTKTPLSMFAQDGVNVSAASVSATSDGAAEKARDRIRRWRPDMVRIAQLGMAYSGRDPKGQWQAMFAPVRSLGTVEAMQAAVNAKAAGMPFEGIAADVIQAEPDTIANWRRWRDEELLYAPAGA